MADVKIDIKESPFVESPVVPEQFDENHVIKFNCYKGIECFSACCRNIDITLTPHDILRLKKRLALRPANSSSNTFTPSSSTRTALPASRWIPWKARPSASS